MKVWFILGLVFVSFLMYQNCSPGMKTSILPGLDKREIPVQPIAPSGSVDLDPEALSVTDNSLKNQNICSMANSVTLTMKKNSFEEHLCTDRSRLSSLVTPGLVCSGGATISNFPVPSQTVSCQEITVCGVRYTSKQVYSKFVTLTFDNLPWGCDGKVDVAKPDAAGNPEVIIKTLVIFVEPPGCHYCASSRIQTCGACADPGCKDGATGAHYSVGETKNDICPIGEKGVTGVLQCSGVDTWQVLVPKKCSIPKCSFNGADFEVGAVRSDACTDKAETTAYSCGPDGNWIAGIKAACGTKDTPTTCTFDGKIYQVADLRTVACGGGSAGGVYRCDTNGQWSKQETLDCGTPTVSTPPTGNTCPAGYIGVPVSQVQKRFCVAKYEMKIDDPKDTDPAFNNVFTLTKKPVSKPQSRPWTNLSRENAISACQSLGTNYDLISNEQWQILAKEIASNKVNWMTANSKGEYSPSAAIAQGQVNQGNAFNRVSTSADSTTFNKSNYALLYSASTEDEKNVCGNLTPCTTAGAGGTLINKSFYMKRTHTLSNGKVIWDLAGNANEWIKDDAPGPVALDSFMWMTNLPSSNVLNYREYSNGEGLACSPVTSPVSNRGCGYGLFRTAPSGSARAVIRGGGAFVIDRSAVTFALGGIFSTFAGIGTAAHPQTGFRCVYKIDQ